MNTYSVYKHTDKTNGKVYIGITSRPPEERWGYHGAGYQPRKKGSSPFYNAILKHGWENFEHEILFSGLSKKEAEEIEIELISKYHSDEREYGYNIEHGGNASGKLSDAQRKAVHDSWQDENAREKRAKKISNSRKGMRFSDEHKRHLSEARKGRYKGSSANNARAINQLTLDGELIRSWGSIAEARDALHLCSANICRAIKYNRTCGGYKWEYRN